MKLHIDMMIKKETILLIILGWNILFIGCNNLDFVSIGPEI